MKKNNRVLAIFGNVVNFGQERSNTEVFKLLVDNGYEVLALVNERGFHWHLQPVFDKFHIPYKKIRYPWGIYKTASLFHILQWGIDILLNNVQFIYYYIKFKPNFIHCGNEYMFKCLFIPLILLRAKIIFRLGDEPVIKYKYNLLFWKKVIVKRVDTLVCVSSFIQGKVKECGRIGTTRNKDKVIYNFPPTRIISNVDKCKSDDFVLGFIGQISENKGVELLVKAAIVLCKKYSNIRFVFAGGIDDNPFADKMFTLLQKEDIAIRKRISFIGLINNVASFYENINVCVTPSIYHEALGNVIVEAKLYRKPSVIFPTGGMPELIHHCHDGYICKGKNIDALIAGIEYYIQSPIKAEEHGEKAFCSIKEMKLDYESYKAQWLDIYAC